MGPTQLYKLGMMEKDLLEPALKLKAQASPSLVQCSCSSRARTGPSGSGAPPAVLRGTGQEQLMLSREACKQLGIIPAYFPAPKEYRKKEEICLGSGSRRLSSDVLTMAQGWYIMLLLLT